MRVGKVNFEWNEGKNDLNKKKHGVDFREAATIFLNSPIRIFFDPDHSEDEERYVAIGISINSRTLVVVHCESLEGITVRIISARKATKQEQRLLHGGV
ncbi:MAG: hypothetical protein A2Z20_09310 [Bdellovibrionales bacterium RBG_16_40_8]|nr:MAG: hypothetical protein A2Z20_09310 [Bdellovibrionales bacterium RBG_16_40_8]